MQYEGEDILDLLQNLAKNYNKFLITVVCKEMTKINKMLVGGVSL